MCSLWAIKVYMYQNQYQGRTYEQLCYNKQKINYTRVNFKFDIWLGRIVKSLTVDRELFILLGTK